MGEVNFFEKGVVLIKEATDLDSQKQYDEALDRYQKGVEYLVTHLKCMLSCID